MSKNPVLVVVLRVGEIPELREIDDRLEVYQQIVGGDIELLPWRSDFLAYVNEGRDYEELPFNVALDGHIVRGPLVVSGHAGRGKERALTPQELMSVMQHLREMPRTLLAFNKQLRPAGGMIAKQRAQRDSAARKAERAGHVASASSSRPRPGARLRKEGPAKRGGR
ncbi:DUF3846 domain-containing protein [Pendulispora rubella]|uniref:DUF3846 domain-containing protein n=1 Tax=Pendulispora rubella TaxID=2741070 RepID=A0ABZ2KU36_9BACT